MDEGDGGTHDSASGDVRGGNPDPNWLDRHMTKVVAVVAVLCLIAFIGRALTG